MTDYISPLGLLLVTLAGWVNCHRQLVLDVVDRTASYLLIVGVRAAGG